MGQNETSHFPINPTLTLPILGRESKPFLDFLIIGTHLRDELQLNLHIM